MYFYILQFILVYVVEWVNGLGGGILEDIYFFRQKEGGVIFCILGGGGIFYIFIVVFCRRYQISRLIKYYKKNYSYFLFIRYIFFLKVCFRFILVIRFIMFINIFFFYYIFIAVDGVLVEVVDRILADIDVVKDYYWSGIFQIDRVFFVFCRLIFQIFRFIFYKEV